MFPSPSTSTPFSVKDILNLEHSHDALVSSLEVSSRMDCCTVPTSSSSSSSCMLARLKQEPPQDMSSSSHTAGSLFGEDLQEHRAGRGNALNFANSFYGKSLYEMDLMKDGKSEAFEGKRRKGEITLEGKFDFVGLGAQSEVHGLTRKMHNARRNVILSNDSACVGRWCI